MFYNFNFNSSSEAVNSPEVGRIANEMKTKPKLGITMLDTHPGLDI